MKFWSAVRTLLVAAVVSMPVWAQAQEATGGRTDGPEGSEIGHGGYSRQGGGSFSLQLDWGAAVPTLASGRVPIFLGATASFWVDDWIVIDGSGFYSFDNRGSVLVGPRFRTGTYPVSAYLGVKAGAQFYTGFAAFAITPQAGADLLVNDKILFGLNYALDLGFPPRGIVFPGRSNPDSLVSVGHRIFMSIGYRF